MYTEPISLSMNMMEVKQNRREKTLPVIYQRQN